MRIAEIPRGWSPWSPGSPGPIIFFFASAAARPAYLTVSETFQLEIRALAIAFFYAVGTGGYPTYVRFQGKSGHPKLAR